MYHFTVVVRGIKNKKKLACFLNHDTYSIKSLKKLVNFVIFDPLLKHIFLIFCWFFVTPWNHCAFFPFSSKSWCGGFCTYIKSWVNLSVERALLCEWPIESIGKCFVFYLYPHLNIRSNKSAYIAGICFRI